MKWPKWSTFTDPNSRLQVRYVSWQPLDRCCRYILSYVMDGDEIVGENTFYKADRICDRHRRKTDKESYEAAQKEAIANQPPNPLASDKDWESENER